MERLRLWSIGAVLAIAVCGRSGLRAQMIMPAAPTAEDAALEARAAALREAFVHKFGTPAEIEAFDHPHEGKRQKHEIDGAGSGWNAKDAVAKTYDQVFRRMIFAAYADAAKRRPTAGDAISKSTSATANLERMIPGEAGRALAAETMARGGDAARKANEGEKEAELAKARDAALQTAIASVLSAEDMERYVSGDYKTRAALLFKAGVIMLKNRPVPDGYMVFLWDPFPVYRATGPFTNGGGQLSSFYPEMRPAFRPIGTQGWSFEDALQSRFLHDGEEAFAAPTISASFIARIPPLGSSRFYMLSDFGPTADAQFQAVDGQTKDLMKSTALAMYMAGELVIGTYIAAQ